MSNIDTKVAKAHRGVSVFDGTMGPSLVDVVSSSASFDAWKSNQLLGRHDRDRSAPLIKREVDCVESVDAGPNIDDLGKVLAELG